jgi:hypothetical protein
MSEKSCAANCAMKKRLRREYEAKLADRQATFAGPTDDATLNGRAHCRFRIAEYCAGRLPGLRHFRTFKEN